MLQLHLLLNHLSVEFLANSFSSKKAQMKEIVALGSITNGLYNLKTVSTSSTLSVGFSTIPRAYTGITSCDLWHSRLAHPSNKVLHLLAKNICLPTLDIKNKSFCSICPLAKGSFVSKHVRFAKPFDLLYMDLWTSPVIATTGAKYFLVVDDFSHFM